MCRKRKDTLRRGPCRVFTSFTRVRQASNVLSPGRHPHWLGLVRPIERVAKTRPVATILSRIFDTRQRRRMIRKEVGDTLEGFPGLSTTRVLATFRETWWYPRETSGKSSWSRMERLIVLTLFQLR